MTTQDDMHQRRTDENQQWFWLFPVSQFRWLWGPFALHLQKRTEFQALLIVPTEEDRQYYLDQADGALATNQVAVKPDYLATAAAGGSADEPALVERARNYEKRLNINMMRDIVQSDRHLGRGFMPGWNRLPRSHAADKSTHASILRACLQQADFYDTLAVSHPPELVVTHGGGTGIANKHVPLLCRERHVPFRTLAMGRIGGLHYWADDEFDGCDELEARIRSFRNVTPDEVKAAQTDILPTGASSVFRRAITHRQALQMAICTASRVLLQQVYIHMRGFSKSKYGYRSISKAYSCLRTYSDWRYLNRPDCLTLDKLPKDRKLVYFPLQSEPEASLQAQSPECSHQVALIHEIALSLPADALLVVKEHPAQIGRRPRDVYEQVKGMSNAVLVAPGESSLDLIRRSYLVCAINSSAAYEAAILGKKVAVFSHHGVIKAVGHVHRVDVSDCLRKIPELLTDEGAATAARREFDGARVYYAIRSYCIDLSPLKIYGRRETPEDSELRLLSDAILESLAVQQRLAS